MPSLRSADAVRLKQQTEEVTKAMSIITLTIICKRIGIRKSVKPQQEPFWKRRTEGDIARLRKDVSHLDDWFKEKWKQIKKKERRAKEEIQN